MQVVAFVYAPKQGFITNLSRTVLVMEDLVEYTCMVVVYGACVL